MPIDIPAPRPTVADRIAVCVAAFPPVAAHTDKSGSPYQILTVDDGMRVVIANADGDRVGGTGLSIDDAVTALEAKLHV